MPVEEHRRVALFRAAADSWGQEVAETMSGYDAGSERWKQQRAIADARLQQQRAIADARLEQQRAIADARLEQQRAIADARWKERVAAQDAEWDARLKAMHARFDAMDQRMINNVERALREGFTDRTPWLVLWQVGFTFALAAFAFALIG